MRIRNWEAIEAQRNAAACDYGLMRRKGYETRGQALYAMRAIMQVCEESARRGSELAIWHLRYAAEKATLARNCQGNYGPSFG